MSCSPPGQAPLSMKFSRQEYWSGLPFPSPGDLPDRGIEPGSPALQADSLPAETPGKPFKLHMLTLINLGNLCRVIRREMAGRRYGCRGWFIAQDDLFTWVMTWGSRTHKYLFFIICCMSLLKVKLNIKLSPLHIYWSSLENMVHTGHFWCSVSTLHSTYDAIHTAVSEVSAQYMYSRRTVDEAWNILYVLGWPKSSFGFSYSILRQTGMNFLANPILFHVYLLIYWFIFLVSVSWQIEE